MDFKLTIMKNKSLLITIAILIIAVSSVAQVTGSFTDSRDGKTYKTVTIGTQTWMAENLAYKAIGGSWKYDNDAENLTTYGYLYDWETAQKVSPAGWHLPSLSELSVLENYLGGASNAGGKLKSIEGWNGPNLEATNSSGFYALPGGQRYYDGTYTFIGYYGRGWTSDDYGKDFGWHWVLSCKNGEVLRSRYYLKSYGLSVRCIKD